MSAAVLPEEIHVIHTVEATSTAAYQQSDIHVRVEDLAYPARDNTRNLVIGATKFGVDTHGEPESG